MGFYYRLIFYVSGVLLGIFILWFSLSFREKPISFNYLPNARVVSHILKNNLHISEYVKCKMVCYKIDSLLLRQYISHSKVDFKKSQIRNKVCKNYFLENNLISFEIMNCYDSISVVNLIIEDSICKNCN